VEVLVLFFGSLLALSAFGLLTTYILYPVVVIWWSKLNPGRDKNRDRSVPESWPLPTVSFLIAAYNEEEVIEDKLKNTLAIDYPEDKFEVIVASDGSTDATDDLVRNHPDPRVRLVRNDLQGGKTATTNLAVRKAKGQVLVFSDATGMFSANSVRSLVDSLGRDPVLGAVAGRVTYDYGSSQTAKGFKLYQKWVVSQRIADPIVHTATSVSGSIHAIWKELFLEAPSHLSYDMFVPAAMAIHGRCTGYCADATSAEVSRSKAEDEFRARQRIGLRAYSFVGWLWQNRARMKNRGYLWQLFFHKVLRWFSVHLMLIALVSHIALATICQGVMAWTLLGHTSLYALAGLVVFADRAGIPIRGSGPLLLFSTTNAAFFVAFFRWIRGAKVASWTPDRDAEREARGDLP